MNQNTQENVWVRRVRLLTQLLILSMTLNIGLCATFVYLVVRENQEEVPLELRPVEKAAPSSQLTNEAVLRNYAGASFNDLLFCLDNAELVEEGCKKRDLALGCLVAFHHFNLERALGGLFLQQRTLKFRNEEESETLSLSIFPGLADYQFQAILHYAKTEKWPLTSQGLFFALKRKEERGDPTLIDAFSLTPEFHAVFTLFNRSGVPISKEMIIRLVTEADWDRLETFTKEQRQFQELTAERRRAFLSGYAEGGSKIALHLLFRTDVEFILKRFSDEQILVLLEGLEEKILGLEPFLKELLLSLRSDEVREKAARKLYALKGEKAPDLYDHRKVLEMFIPEALPKETPKQEILLEPSPAPARKKLFHLIQPGDSLWKIARRYHITIDALKTHNHLESDRLKVGKQLEIPQGEK